MYTWGYIKEAALAKLDISSDEAIKLGLMNKFPYYANEALTQICSTVKPRHTYFNCEVVHKEQLIGLLKGYYGDVDELAVFNKLPELLTNNEKAFLAEYSKYVFINEPIRMPNDFVSFTNDVTYIDCGTYLDLATPDDFIVYGDNQLLFKRSGKYRVPYNARWFMFTSVTDDTEVLDIPADVLDCIPTYIVSQCLKIDDEVKAAIYRNEYELFLSRIEDTYTDSKEFRITGGW